MFSMQHFAWLRTAGHRGFWIALAPVWVPVRAPVSVPAGDAAPGSAVPMGRSALSNSAFGLVSRLFSSLGCLSPHSETQTLRFLRVCASGRCLFPGDNVPLRGPICSGLLVVPAAQRQMQDGQHQWENTGEKASILRCHCSLWECSVPLP